MIGLAQSKPSSWQVAKAAEGIAAAQFARCGFDVSVQHGADKPGYELVVAKADNLLKVSVKGSQDGFWNLAQSYLKMATELSGKKGDYHGAIFVAGPTWSTDSVLLCSVSRSGDRSVASRLPGISKGNRPEIAGNRKGAGRLGSLRGTRVDIHR